MQINQLEIADTTFGKFVGCAIMSEKQHIPEYDFSKLELKITLDGHELDPRKVFGAWERAIAGPAEISAAPEPVVRVGHDGEDIVITRSELDRLIYLAEQAYDECESADSYVSDQFDNVVSEIDRAVRNSVRDTLVECVHNNSVAEPTDDARGTISDLIEDLRNRR